MKIGLLSLFHHRATEGTEGYFFVCREKTTNTNHQSRFQREFLAEGLSYFMENRERGTSICKSVTNFLFLEEFFLIMYSIFACLKNQKNFTF